MAHIKLIGICDILLKNNTIFLKLQDISLQLLQKVYFCTSYNQILRSCQTLQQE